MARKPIARDANGELIDASYLTEEEGGATVTGVRSARPEHPSWGLSPEGLASILRDSEGTDPSRFYALCDDIEEKDGHYNGVLSQRRLAVSQLPITVDPASDAKDHIEHADLVRLVIKRPDTPLTLMAMLNALGKGFSPHEIVWDTSEKQWMPDRFVWNQPEWFRFSQHDLRTPLLLDERGQPQPLKPRKWMIHRPMLTPGIPIRDGLTRGASWAWMFKNFDIKAWMIFLDKFGQPLRIGKYNAGSSGPERATLLRALRSLGSDAAAMIPEAMMIELIESTAKGGDAFQGNANFWDEQNSKRVVGQTGTTDASKGGYAVGRVHDGVRASICSYDGIILSTTFGRDVVRPLIDMNFGPQKAYPLVKIGLPEEQNLELVLKTIFDYVDRGLPVEASQIYPLLGLTEPAKGPSVVLLKPIARAMPGEQPGGPPAPPRGDRADPPGGAGALLRAALLAAADPSTPVRDSFDEATLATLEDLGWVPELGAMEAELAACTTIAEGRAVLRRHLDTLGTEKLAEILAQSRFAARLAGETEQ
mgnify:CR=1 FL=1